MFRTVDGPAAAGELIDAAGEMLPAGTDMFGRTETVHIRIPDRRGRPLRTTLN
jgi:hypothetical protein